MTWFYNLRRLVRNVIVGALWGILAVVAGVIGGVYEWQTDNVPAALAVLILAVLAVAIVFTVFAIKATAKEKAAARQKEKDEQAAQAAIAEEKRKADTPAWVYAPVEDTDDTDDRNVEGVRVRLVNHGCNFPIRTKAVGVTFDDCQTNIAASEIGDALIIKHAPNGRWIESTDIINARTGERVGRIQKELAFALLDEFGDGFVFDGEICDLTGGTEDAPTRGCNIVITGAHV